LQLQQWIDGYNTENTRSAARKAHIAWNKYLEWKNIDEKDLIKEIKSDEDSRYHKLMEFKMDYVKLRPVAQSTMKQYLVFLPKYFRMVHGVKTERSEIEVFLGKQKLLQTDRIPFTKDIIKMLIHAANDIHKVQYLILSSSGMRISESLLIDQKHYDFDSDPVKISIPAAFTKTKIARIVFISKEAVKALNDTPEYWEKRTLGQDEVYFNRLRKKVNLIEKYANSRNYLYNLHSFRAFFRTEAGKINHDFAEKILGHNRFDTHYVRLDETEKSEYYKKLEKNIRIF